MDTKIHSETSQETLRLVNNIPFDIPLKVIERYKLSRHGDATNHFYVARKNAYGNEAILKSDILNAHAPMKREDS